VREAAVLGHRLLDVVRADPVSGFQGATDLSAA